ncbi:MAG: hydrogenase formation protein HypD [Candidatus Zixiibacteriota bacterium]
MKYIDEYRDGEAARKMARAIHGVVTRPWTIMEVCGGQTHSIARFGIEELLPSSLTIVHGPGCPVCVTPIEQIDRACALAARPGVTFCSFGDMLRVPGSRTDLLTVKSMGGDVRMVYSPTDAVEIARTNRDREVVFFAVGFETTAPANALAVRQAYTEGLTNFSILVSQVLVPPAMRTILSSPSNRVQGFLAAGHVCTVAGYAQYDALAAQYHVPIVVTGFEPLDILQGILMCVRQLEEGRAEVENQYARAVSRAGNVSAQAMMDEVFEVTTRAWRGIGQIEQSGLSLREKYKALNAEARFGLTAIHAAESGECESGLILQGVKKPPECAAFGTRCTPEHPLGATMVSSEGACAAYYRYKRR